MDPSSSPSVDNRQKRDFFDEACATFFLHFVKFVAQSGAQSTAGLVVVRIRVDCFQNFRISP
jgi:hypothetical protein